MITGKKINLRLFRDEQDVLIRIEKYNDLSNRAITDHTEIYNSNTNMKKFQETGFWGKDNGCLLVTTKKDEIVGSISFSRTTDFELGIGYRMYDNKYRNKGFMSEALTLFSAYLFETVPHITRLMIITADDNTPSRKLAEKCGYTQEGVHRKAYFYRGKICDWIQYSMLREESPNFEDLLIKE